MLRCALLVSVAMLASCKSCDDAPAKPFVDAAPPVASSGTKVVVTPDAGAAAVISDAEAPHDASTTLSLEGDGGGASSCKLSYGPAELPFRGPAAITSAGQELRLVANDSGKPRIIPIAIPAKGAAPVAPPPKPASFVGMRWPPCELAGRFAYCQAPGNAIVRSVLEGGGEAKTVGKNRASTRIAAASLSPEHSVVAFLESRKTTEGDMLQAFVAFDDKDPVKASDEGAGATTLRFVERPGGGAALVYLDTRTAMVPVHARPVSLKDNNLSLGTDAVVFVGGAPERGIDFTIAKAGGKAFALVPMPQTTIEFGMAAIAIEDPPKEDTNVQWSRYPNGIDPAPIGSAPTKDAKDGKAWVARVRPHSKEVGSPKVLELGQLDASGVFTSLGELGPGKNITDISLFDDGAGVWVLYGDTTVTWLERRICPR